MWVVVGGDNKVDEHLLGQMSVSPQNSSHTVADLADVVAHGASGVNDESQSDRLQFVPGVGHRDQADEAKSQSNSHPKTKTKEKPITKELHVLLVLFNYSTILLQSFLRHF